MAATRIHYAKMGVLSANQEAYDDLYDKTIDMYIERQDKIPEINLQFFNEQTADNLTWTMTTVSGILNLPRKTSDTSPVSFDQAAPGYPVTATIETFENAVAITKTMEKIDRSGKIGRMLGGLPDSARRYLEMAAADYFNSGTSTAGADGSNLFANDHYHVDAQAGTWSNIETGAALTTTTLNAMAVNMAKRKNEKGFTSPRTMLQIMVPPDLREKAIQVTKSDQVAETSTNAVNVYKGIVPIINPYSTSTTAYFGIGDRPEENGLYYVVLTPPTVSRLDYPNGAYPKIAAAYHLYMQVAFAAERVQNMHYNAGA